MRVSYCLILTCLLAAVGCRERLAPSTDAAAGWCEYAGERYRDGESFPDADGCNTCFCESDGEVACTLALCVDETPGVCAYGGSRHAIGASFYAADGCSVCFCQPSGQVGCSARPCADAAVSVLE